MINEEYYNILNIEKGSNVETIKNAFRKLSMKYHPSKDKNYTNKYNNIVEAYKYLINNQTNNNQNSINSINNNNNNNYNNNYCNNTKSITNENSNANNLMLYNSIPEICNNYNNYNNYNKYTEDIIYYLNITFEQSYNGSNVPVKIDRFIVINNIIKEENETIYIEIPRGIDNDEIIILENKGHIYNNNSSNLKIYTKLIEHKNYIRKGLDIYYNIDISFKESLVGFSFIINYLNNKQYKIVNNGEITHNNSKKIIENIGFNRDNYCGNLIITFNINYPQKLTNEVIELLKKIL